MMKKILLFAGLSLSVITACKKKANTEPAPDPLTSGTSLEKMLDSVYLYAKEDYYWSDAMPDYNSFSPRSLVGTDELTSLQAAVYKLSQFKVNPTTGRAYEYYSASRAKYSFIDAGSASARLNAVSGDFGFAPVYIAANDLRVKYVYAGSPADVAGVKRGYQIISINSRTALNGTNSSDVAFVNNAISQSSSITLILRKPDGSSVTVSLNTSSYTIKPVITSKVLDQGNGKKVGYLVFNSFVSLASTQSALDAAFSTFATAGVNELVIDLRYNLGGYVETAEYLTDLIVPSSANGKVMFASYFNPTLTANKGILLKNQVRKDNNGVQYNYYDDINYSLAANTRNVAKKGSLSSLTRVFFLVTSSTASASELTINNLRPYMNVQLIGATTFGKPVGFFDIKIGKYEMYIPEFETKNANGEGGYFAGMTPGSTTYPGKLITDDVTKEFGDPTEKLLAQALNYVNNGVYTNETNLQVLSTGSAILSEQALTDVNQMMEKKNFNGMIFNSFPRKNK